MESARLKTPFPLAWGAGAAVLEQPASLWSRDNANAQNDKGLKPKAPPATARNGGGYLIRGRKRNAPNVRQPVLPVVPATVGQVDAPHEGHRLVDHDDLLVMGPQVDGGGDVVGVAHHLPGQKTANSGRGPHASRSGRSHPP